jgi:hypothetical protein
MSKTCSIIVKHKKVAKADVRRYTLYIKEHLTGELKTGELKRGKQKGGRMPV